MHGAASVSLPRAPHPAATGGGFGFGKFRRDEPPSFHFVAPRQGCLVQKLGNCIHRSLWGARPSRLPFSASRRKPSSQTKQFNQQSGRDARTCTRDACAPPDHFICRRFRLVFQNIICLVHNFSISLICNLSGDATPVPPARQLFFRPSYLRGPNILKILFILSKIRVNPWLHSRVCLKNGQSCLKMSNSTGKV